MFTTIDKAIMAFLSSALFLISYWTGVKLPVITPEVQAALAPVIVGGLTWLVPNKTNPKGR